MKILVIGNGQLGSYVALHWNDDRNDEVVVVDYPDIDVTDKHSVSKYVKDCDFIVNCSAYTNVDKAEVESRQCYMVNVNGPSNIAKEVAKYESKRVVFVSSEVVYGSNDPEYKPMDEETEKTPTCVYSHSKMLGDEYVEGRKNVLVLRPGWLFGPGNDHNFIAKVKKLLESRDSIKVTDDQIGSLTSVSLMLNAMKAYADGTLPDGTYNIANDGYASRFENAIFVKHVICSDCEVVPCTSEEFPRPAKIAKNSCLDCNKISQYIKKRVPTWEEDVRKVLDGEM